MTATVNFPTLTVSQLTNAIKLSLESAFPTVSVQGEISNFKIQTSGHLYFSLKDSQAQIGAVMFRADAASLKIPPKEGDRVIIKGELTVYPPKGGYQIVVRELSQVGLGELLLKLEELKIKLHKLGWFSSKHKKPLPKSPQRIGVVTSPTGAVIQDILNILNRRACQFHLILNPVRVQGEGAANEIAQAIEQFNRYNLVDVIIVGRGGGSIEDLWAFNEEVVAAAIFNSKIPIIAAVGHETDHTIACYVADLRAPTPSAAAEIVVAERGQQLQHLQRAASQLQQTISHMVQKQRQRLLGIIRQPIISSPYAVLGPWLQKLDHLRDDIDQSVRQLIEVKRQGVESRKREAASLNPINRIQHYKQRLNEKQQSFDHLLRSKLEAMRKLFNASLLQKKLDQLFARNLALRKERLDQLESALKSIDPKNLLKKGYSILFSEKLGSVINSVKQVEKNEKVRCLLSDGEAIATVEETR
jgi:exodeoxyribonuclease VII large subunit